MVKIIRRFLFALGVNLTRPTTPDADVLGLIRALRPQNCGVSLVRIGGPGDGGYLVPDDLQGIEYCFSPGVSTSSTFEEHLANLHVRSFLADYSVDGPVISRPEFTFDKKFLGATDNEKFFTLESWKKKYLESYDGDLILQMDIEGYEYQVLLNASTELLNQFRVVVIEFHYLDRMFDPFGFELISSCFQKLLEQFYVVHIHPNNVCGSVTKNGIEVPKAMEFTFLNKRRVNHVRPQEVFPHALDAPNAGSPSLHLPKRWYSDK